MKLQAKKQVYCSRKRFTYSKALQEQQRNKKKLFWLAVVITSAIVGFSFWLMLL